MSQRPALGESIAVVLRQLMDERKLSYRSLAALTREADSDRRGVSYAYIAALVAGRESPSRRAMELTAAALGIEPDDFAEYRLARLRIELDPRRVGFEAAWKRYAELVGASA